MIKIYKKAVLPGDFQASATSCGIKRSAKPDLALFYSRVPAKAACLFTTNKMLAAPLKVNKEQLKLNNVFKAIIVNSGNANCFTGKPGIKDAQNTVKSLAIALDIEEENVLVNSTGIIGKRLPLKKIIRGIPKLVANLSPKGIEQAKLAIMTTDTFSKEITAKFKVGRNTLTICAVAKGAGMISPDMATMLAFIFTDANISQGSLNKALKVAVDNSFNCITVDGCMSTNDSVIVLANGAAKNSLINSGKSFKVFQQALNLVCLKLAKMVVGDGEGASKFIQIKVNQAKSFSEAKKIALAIANSNLFKTAMYGENPNFGRIVASVGASGVNVNEEALKIRVSSLKMKDIFVGVSVNRGKHSATIYTSDLTPEYIKINAEYN